MLNMKDELSKNRSKERQYAFDTVFDRDAGQIEIFNNTTKFLIEGIIEGYNATVFAYGATGAGKTYTMIGAPDNPGLMFLTIHELFDRVSQTQSDKSYQIKVSFLEIYNEMIRDLLIITNDILDLREDAEQGIHVAGLSVIDVDSPKEVMDLLFFGNENRTQEATNANATSSRSHAVLEIQITQKNKGEGVEEDISVGKLSMIDLAGSERAARTQNRGIRLVEGAMINKSLLSLGNCINALVENMEKGTENHIPYRDSKLTRLLKDSLGGNSRTVMIANVSPSDLSYEDSNNTLKYANRAKNIKTTAVKNVKHVQHHVSEYTKIISQLKDEINELKHKLSYDKQPLIMIMSENDVETQNKFLESSKEIEDFLVSLSDHFFEETKLVKRVDELNNKNYMNKLSTVNTKIIFEQTKLRYGKDSDKAKLDEKELKVLLKNESDFKHKLNQ
jgi:kinesin family protein 18/19